MTPSNISYLSRTVPGIAMATGTWWAGRVKSSILFVCSATPTSTRLFIFVYILHVDDGPKEEGLVVIENFQELLACPLSVVQLDLASPELMSWGVWSWSSGYSSELHISRTYGVWSVSMGCINF